MKPRKWFGAVLAGAALTAAASGSAQTTLERIATAVLADKFGIDTREVVVLQERSNLDVFELAPIYEGAYYFRRSPNAIWDLRRQGLGWGQIAHRVGMHPGTFNKLRNQGAFDRDRFWTTAYRERFAVPVERVTIVRRDGGTLEDVLAAIIIGKLTNRDPAQVYDRFRTDRSWSTVSSAYDVRFEDWRRVAVPVRTRYVIPVRTTTYVTRTVPTWTAKKPSKSASKSRASKVRRGGDLAEWNESGKGHSQGKGKGSDKSKSKGGKKKSRGNGKGKGG